MKSTALLIFFPSVSLALPQASTDKCTPLELLWARGTIEPQSSYGPLVGDSFISQLKRAIPEMSFYNVVYPAGMGSSSPDQGVSDTLKRLQSQAVKCPNQKFVLGGYSQGAVVMHRAAVKMSPEILARIVATATFGDGGQQATRELQSADWCEGEVLM
jgi:cutinase